RTGARRPRAATHRGLGRRWRPTARGGADCRCAVRVRPAVVARTSARERPTGGCRRSRADLGAVPRARLHAAHAWGRRAWAAAVPPDGRLRDTGAAQPRGDDRVRPPFAFAWRGSGSLARPRRDARPLRGTALRLHATGL